MEHEKFDGVTVIFKMLAVDILTEIGTEEKNNVFCEGNETTNKENVMIKAFLKAPGLLVNHC